MPLKYAIAKDILRFSRSISRQKATSTGVWSSTHSFHDALPSDAGRLPVLRPWTLTLPPSSHGGRCLLSDNSDALALAINGHLHDDLFSSYSQTDRHVEPRRALKKNVSNLQITHPQKYRHGVGACV